MRAFGGLGSIIEEARDAVVRTLYPDIRDPQPEQLGELWRQARRDSPSSIDATVQSQLGIPPDGWKGLSRTCNRARNVDSFHDLPTREDAMDMLESLPPKFKHLRPLFVKLIDRFRSSM